MNFNRSSRLLLAVCCSAAFSLAAADTNPPVVLNQNPVAGSTLSSLTQITVTFNEPVINVSGGDLVVNGTLATNLAGAGAVYTFSFPQPAAGTVHIAFDSGHGITDLATNGFDATGTNTSWDYTLLDQVPPTVALLSPLAGATVGSLVQLSATFSEPVLGVDAADLRINGQPASSVSGSGAGPYIFSFAAPPAGPVQFDWAVAHGIHDTASVPNNFAGGSWSYSLQPGVFSGNIIINEFLVSNRATNGWRDEDGELEPWIEIYNRGGTAVNLYGWGLTDNADQPDQWTFPAVTINPSQYLIVFASGKNRTPTNGANLHANFSLAGSGEYLGLFNADYPREVTTQFTPKFPEQRADISYGLISNSFTYLGVPTPGAANAGSVVFSGVTADPKASVKSGFFNQPFAVSLTTATPGAAMRYTLDGSEPTPTSGTLYTGALNVAGSATKAVVMLRATAFATGLLSSHVSTYSYIFPDYVLLQPTNPPNFPSQWINTTNSGAAAVTINADYEMDPQVLTNVAYMTVARLALTNIPTLSLVMNTGDLFSQTNGIYANPSPLPAERYAWERPVAAELILPDGSSGFKIDAGLRAQGGSSRDATRTLKHSMRLFFKGDYGAGKLNYLLYPDSPVQSFNTIVVDAGLNLNWHNLPDSLASKGQMVRDQFISDLELAMGHPAPHGRFVHVYLNGLYWGLHYLHERPDDTFAESYFGGDKSQYDVVRNTDGFEVVAGDAVAWNLMMALANSGLANSDNLQYEQVLQYLDLDNFIDYMLVNFYGGNGDWALHNWYAIRKRQAGAGFKFPSWDAEVTLKDVNESSAVGKNEGNSPTQLHAALKNNAEYRLHFMDRLNKQFFNGGVLFVDTNNPAVDPANPQRNRPGAYYMKRIDEIAQAIVLESARWGDGQPARVNNPYTRNVEWTNELNSLRNVYFPKRSSNMINQFKTQGLWPNTLFGGVLPPVFSQHGGTVPLGFNLTMSSPTGTIYYTTNSVDPRVYGTGAVSPSAFAYAGVPLTLSNSVVIKARARNTITLTWSPLTEATFTVASLVSPLRITELMYNPSPGASAGDAYEFIELQNIGAAPLDVSGFYFDGITFIFPSATTLAPGAVIVLASADNPANFATRYPGVTVFSYYSGHLSNGGDRVAIHDATGRTLLSVDYNDANGWPTQPDGNGPSLEIIDVNGNPDDPANWRASTASNGTPGTVTPPPAPGAILLNEVMADNVNAVNNGGTFPDWVELYNPTGTNVSLTGWSLTDSGNARKFVFPTTNIIAGGYLVVWCDTNTTTPGPHAGFALARTGATVSLYNAATNRVDAMTYGLQLPNTSVGRVGGIWQLNVPTPRAVNQAAAVANATNLVINEWQANSPPSASDWIELYNRSSTLPIALKGFHLATSNALFQITSLSFVAPLGYVQLFADEGVGPDRLDFKLSAAGGAIILYDPGAALIDSVAYGPQTEGLTEGRLPDGSATIVDFPGGGSPGAMNFLFSYSGPRLNEVMARNSSAVLDTAGRYADWFELYNPNGTNFDVSGMSVSVDLVQAGQWVIPNGTILGPNAYRVIWCDGNRAASQTLETDLNTGLSLNGNSGGVYLFNTNGQLLDWVEYGFQITDKAIGKVGGLWQLLASPTPKAANSAAAPLGAVTNVCFNEWMADPLSGNDWFELYNRSTNAVNLGGLYLTDDPSLSGLMKFLIAPLSFINGRDWVKWEADGQPSQGRNHVNFTLDNSGESIRLYNTNLTTLDAVDFTAQDAGVSEGRLPDGATNLARFTTTPTPGDSNYLPLTNAVVNEVLSHTDPPLEDAVEFFNPTASPVTITGWYLSNTKNDLKRYLITNTTPIPAGGYVVFYQYQFGPSNGVTAVPPQFDFNSAHGDQVYLSSAAGGNLTGYRTGQSFDAAANGVSFGRYPTSVGVDFTALSLRTFGVDNPATVAQFRTGTGLSNAYPLIGPVVINEIMYHPSPDTNGMEDTNLEFVELYNRSNNVTPLYDTAHPTNRWRLDNAVRFDFKTNTSISAGGYLLVVPFDPTNAVALANFRAKYGTNGTPMVGPCSGTLGNAGASVELWRPDNPQTAPHPDAGFVPYLLADRVQYADAAPWPPAADGGGASLQRILPPNYGNDPVNWMAVVPTAGLTNAGSGGATPPLIISQPTNKTVIAGGSATFNVVATGTPSPGYQWQFNGTNLAAATASSLTIANAQFPNAGSYLVRVTNTVGTVFSQPATLTVGPAITSQPASQSVSVGANVTFTVAATGSAPLAYQWFFGGVPRANATNASLNLAGAQVEDSGSYYVVVTNLAGSALSQTATLTVSGLDSDGDGMPDSWELAHGLNPNNPFDAALDSDGDGMTNLQEYLAGTDPQDPLSYLKIDSISLRSANQIVLSFAAVAGKSYTLLYRDLLNAGSWHTLLDVPSDPTTRTIQITNQVSPGVTNRFYWLATPLQPYAFKIDSVYPSDATHLVMGFLGVAGKSYSVLYRDSLTTGSWLKLLDVFTDPTTTRVVQVTNQLSANPGKGFYRLVTPPQS